jgi:hypothetical protein
VIGATDCTSDDSDKDGSTMSSVVALEDAPRLQRQLVIGRVEVRESTIS